MAPTSPSGIRKLLLVLAVLASTLSMIASPTSANPVTIDIAAAADETNSTEAFRLIDGELGTDDTRAWKNPNPWRATSYPMTAVLDLGETHQLASLRFFVGNLTQGSDRVKFEYSTTASGENFQWMAEPQPTNTWNSWTHVELTGQWARRVRVRFDAIDRRFNIGEVQIIGTPVAVPPTTTATTTTSTPATTAPATTAPPTTTPATTTPATTAPVTTAPATTAPVTTAPVTTTPPVTSPPTRVDQPQPSVPGPNIVRSHGFGNWPNDHLSASCRDLHDRYWTTGQNAGTSTDPNHPDNQAFHTWHPAVTTHPDTGERCDFGHEHGSDPRLAGPEMFALSGGWPAFGYAAAKAGPPRHEDHVGHKVTAARFRAAIGNGAGSPTLYDAGFECTWLSKIHQGSHSLDAFSNHLHEYFLTMRCLDGSNAAGVRDGQTIGTEFSVKLMYTYGRPNRFVEENCAAGGNFAANTLTGPEGQSIMPAMRTSPLGNHASNDRAFVCSSALLYRSLDQTGPNPVAYTDIWNELVEIRRPDDSTALTIQPYYMVKNAARVIEDFAGAPSQIVRTIDLCYRPDGSRLDVPLCAEAPAANPGWESPNSPFNGALRSIHFKAVSQQNQNGPDRFCTDAFGRAVIDPLPCEPGNIEQRIASYDNDFNNGRFSYRGQTGNVAGSIWAEVIGGDRTTTEPQGDGYRPNGIGFEFIVDNRNPDDDHDGTPDGANIRGRN